MNVGKLKAAIKDLPDDMELVIQTDSEGNSYHTASSIDTCSIWDEHKETILSTGWDHFDVCMEPEDWKTLKAKQPRVGVLY